jgi:hypothetical protein
MLRTHCPIRTVEEEQQKEFKEAKPCTVPDTTFARAVDPALRAFFALLRFTDHIQEVHVRGSAGKVDVYFDKEQGTLKIDCRWLEFACMHHRSFASPSLEPTWPIPTPRFLLPCGGRAPGSTDRIHLQGRSDGSTRRNEVHSADWVATAIPTAQHPAKAIPRGHSGQLGR